MMLATALPGLTIEPTETGRSDTTPSMGLTITLSDRPAWAISRLAWAWATDALASSRSLLV